MQTSQEEASTPRWDWIQDQSNPHNGPVGLSYPFFFFRFCNYISPDALVWPPHLDCCGRFDSI